MTTMPDRGDRELRSSIRDLADAFERDATAEADVTAGLEARLRRLGTAQVLGTVGLGLAVVLAVAAGLQLLTQPRVGGPAPMPPLVGIFVTRQPDDAGRCHAVRMYDTTADDGRVALWSWTGRSGCAARTDNLAQGAAAATGVQLPAAAGVPSGAGVLIEAGQEVPSVLEGTVLVLDPRRQAAGGSLLVFPSVQAASAADVGMQMAQVEELEVPYEPE